MYSVFVTLDVIPERLEDFLDGIHANAIASRRDEPGCLRFDVHRATSSPARFYFYEVYRDQDAFEIEHRTAPHYFDWRKVVESCVVSGSQHSTYAMPAFPDDFPERLES
ncbi:MAG TPA: putative quinol monooxygenase [Galbitalea sp.]|jgi:autoinducer 2-degrading protein